MIWVYVNYPNTHIKIHRSAACPEIQEQHKQNERRIRVQSSTLAPVLTDFIENKYRLAATKGLNGFWLDISLGSHQQEDGLAHVIHALLCRKYTPFRSIVPEDCKLE
jgi:hypothetical protein